MGSQTDTARKRCIRPSCWLPILIRDMTITSEVNGCEITVSGFNWQFIVSQVPVSKMNLHLRLA
jgi:hypothetical protein